MITWLEAHQLPCYYKKFLGIECLGCGMQTAFILLLKGEFIESFKTYPALIPIILLFSFLILHLIFRFRRGAFVLKISFIFTITIMVLNYIFKLMHF
ncbi:MAG: DUF2752 domain-containing protein [Bacteroidales bacterium]|nr:DUF2752 domain-containing protein [Bacteroidales bacterium]MCF8404344.1 DUF2752 domain-containing protein [Bacteroidales bacterium]